ncbi:MAG: porin, partial [Alphaproteobacteria bacterium]|nr:porin [Alphaproteobacteria bacterium]
MKKILLGTSALVAAAAFSAPASAAEKIKLSLDGYATFGAAYVDS